MTKNMRRSRRWGLGQVKQVQGVLTDINFKESHFSEWLSNKAKILLIFFYLVGTRKLEVMEPIT